MKQFVFHTDVSRPQAEVFQWHMMPGALERLLPPWEKITAERLFTGQLTKDSEIDLRIRFARIFTLRWRAKHTEVAPPSLFVDQQEIGPFAYWKHEHRFERRDENRTRIEDKIDYETPFAPISEPLFGKFVESKLERMFHYRHTIVKNDLGVLNKYNLPPQNILISGSSGMIGQALKAFLENAGHKVFTLVRKDPSNPYERKWIPSSSSIAPNALRDIQTVIHLSGERIDQRWTTESRKKILKSRVDSTRLLADAISKSERKPGCFIIASGAGYYGDTGDAILTESSPRGRTFLSEVATQWEQASESAVRAGVRTVHMRLGAVLTPAGGALSQMLLPFQCGFGGQLGSGRQFFSWIALDDLLYALYHVMATDSLSGALNFCAPEPVRNEEFTRILGKVLRRPTLLPVPAAALKVILGLMAEELLLASNRTIPQKLVESGYRFSFPGLEAALRHLLGK